MSQKQNTSDAALAAVIYLGIDAHIENYVVVRQVDGMSPQPAQCFRKISTLRAWVGRQQKQAARIVCCYEAGPTGFVPCRAFTQMGLVCVVVAPKRRAENEDRVKTDKRDSRILCQRSESYDRGNESVLNVVRVPSEDEEHRRALGRQREALKKEVLRNAQRGRGQALLHGVRLKGRWWSRKRWEHRKTENKRLSELLQPLQTILFIIEKELLVLTKALKADAVSHERRPKGLGALSWRIIEGEICDFNRFSNRREVASHTGLCPSESSSGPWRKQGFVTKHGNPLLRQYLVESVWRLIKWQPAWHAWKKWQDAFPGASPGKRKQVVVALARTLAIALGPTVQT